VEILKELIAKDPLDADSLYLLAQHEATHGLEELALLHFQQAHVGNGKMKNAALLEKGKLLVKLQRYEEAIKDLTDYQEHAEGSQKQQLESYISAVKNLEKSSQ